ncbi:hypothetical protein JTB14_015396 [Gonioctena quinquepunctata]|nr:hypothetical protein JTB14_015396 [Gonioctena quinquepunctata]
MPSGLKNISSNFFIYIAEFPTLSSKEKHNCGISSDLSSINEYNISKGQIFEPDISDVALETPSNPSKRNQCEICQRTFSRKCHLKSHKLIHTGEKSFQCEQCGTFFRARKTLRVHLITHSGEKPYQCQFCKRNFAHKLSLREHETSIHREAFPEAHMECDICCKMLPSKRALTKHQTQHNKRYHCEICGNSYSKKSNLEDHINTHTDKKTFECTICNKKMSTKNALRQHLYLHSKLEKKQYQCQVCGKTFSKNFHLINHSRIHSGEKPFECEYCKKTFRVKNSYRMHVRIHTGNKPYQCNFCEKRFAQAIHWRRHEETHSEGTLDGVAPQMVDTNVAKTDFPLKQEVEIEHMIIKKEEDETMKDEPEYINLGAVSNIPQ